MKILYRGPFANASGYGQACHDYLMALRTTGLPFEIQLVVDGDTGSLHDRYKPLYDYLGETTTPQDCTHVIVHAIPIEMEQRMLKE